MSGFGSEKRELWPIGTNNPVDRIGPDNPNTVSYDWVTVTGEPKNTPVKGFVRFIMYLLPIFVVGCLIYSGIKSATVSPEYRESTIQSEMVIINKGLDGLGEVVLGFPKSSGWGDLWPLALIFMIPFFFIFRWVVRKTVEVVGTLFSLFLGG